MLNKLWAFLQGKKSYITAVAMVAYALISVYLGKMSWDQAFMWLFGGGTLVSVKSSLTKLQQAH